MTGAAVVPWTFAAVVLLLIRDKVPTLAWGTLLLALTYLLLTNYQAVDDLVDRLTTTTSTRR